MKTDFETQLFSNTEWNWSYDKVFVKPNIPSKKLLNALTYAPNVSPDDVLILIDDTVFGGAKDGMLITNSAIYCHEIMTPSKSFSFSKIEEIRMEKSSQVMVNGRKFFKGQVVNHLTLLTITSRVKKILAALKKDQAPESNNEAEHATKAHVNQGSEAQQLPEPSKNVSDDPLKFSPEDQYYAAIEKMKSVQTATSVAAFFLGDANENKPVSKIVDDFTHSAYKSAALFRKRVIESGGFVKLANDNCTVEVLCYSSAKLFKQLSGHAVPDSILTAIQRKAIPDALFLRENHNVKPLMTVISDYIKSMQNEEAHLELLARIFINNQEQKFATDIQPYSHHIVDSLEKVFTQPFSNFVKQIERPLLQFEAELDRLVDEHVDKVLNILHNR